MAEAGKLRDIPIKGQFDRNATFNGSSWQIRIKTMSDSGEVKYSAKKGFKSADEANEAKELYDREFEKAARRFGFAGSYDADMSVQEYFKYYLEEILNSYCSTSTVMVYRYALYKYILPNWQNDIPLKLLGSDELNQLLDLVNGNTSSIANKVREFMNLALAHACYREHRIDAVPAMKKYPRKKPKVNVFTKPELKIFLEIASESNWYLEILLALFMGLRKGEILGLKVSDFDEERHTVTISRQLAVDCTYEEGGYRKVSSEKKEKEPKTLNSIRTLHVPDKVWDELEKRKEYIQLCREKYGDSYNSDDYISFTDEGKARGTCSMNLALTKLCKRNGIKHMTVHGLRHCYATILLEQKYDLAQVSALLGHSSINTTFDFYADIIEGDENILAIQNELYSVESEDE